MNFLWLEFFSSQGGILVRAFFRIYRLPAGVHLQVAVASLLVMAIVHASTVICNVISKTMEASAIQNRNQKTKRVREGIRLTMIVVGIVTAIICSLALMYEARSTESYGSINALIKTSEFTATNFSMQIVSKAVASLIWPF